MPFNVRALRDVDIHEVPLVSYSGKDRQPAYAPPTTPLSHNLTVPEGKKMYEGSCHCQAVRYAVVSDPLENVEANDCNCSLCGGNGTLWTYHSPSDVHISGKENLGCYLFGIKENHHYFCKTCGVNVYEQRGEEDHVGLNVRLLDGYEDEVKKMTVKKSNGRNDA
ncbi:hypothetical protein QFC21_003247 [Naganishia friedmannii]|uniref:Uncharacterized protein n=1 Tax=Naganishia friedmannii TaxID=89922 RepID=A0ACC2VPK9_9TREE|nr:hypothetical protein QFC21_003247 [Naganishia friedmannii]